MKLEPCPMDGGAAYFERMGTRRQSCIVACEDCGLRLESNEEGEHCGAQWNQRHVPATITAGQMPGDLPLDNDWRIQVTDGAAYAEAVLPAVHVAQIVALQGVNRIMRWGHIMDGLHEHMQVLYKERDAARPRLPR